MALTRHDKNDYKQSPKMSMVDAEIVPPRLLKYYHGKDIFDLVKKVDGLVNPNDWYIPSHNGVSCLRGDSTKRNDQNHSSTTTRGSHTRE